MEEIQSKPHHLQRITSQLFLTSETKLLWTKKTRLTGSKSLGLLGTCASTSLGTLVTPKISSIPPFTEEVLQPQEGIRTDPSVM